MSTTVVPPVNRASGTSWGPGAILGVIAGSLMALVAIGLASAGLAMVVMHVVGRDDDGYMNTPTRQFTTSGYALTVEQVHLGDMHGGAGDWAIENLDGRVRVRAQLRTDDPVFVGIARERDLDAYLAGVSHAEIRDFGHHRANLLTAPGTHAPDLPGRQNFWVASAGGRGEQTAEWKATTGEWAAVVMRADATSGVEADVRAGGKVGWMLWVGVVLLTLGALGLAGGAALITVAGRRGGQGGGAEPSAGSSMSAALTDAAERVAATAGAETYPVHVHAEIGEPLSRWYWLVKWALVIPHLIVLAFLWAGFVLSALASIVAVVFTGRYPRSLFDFNLGVMRWSWRVGLYANGAFAVDRYPPFTLSPDPTYPAHIEIPYPDRELPRLKTAFQWLLAAPHWLIIGALVGGGWWAEDVRIPGLLPILVIIAVLTLLFTGRYPREIFRLIVGIHRWVLRTVAYAAGMRPEYPPFRLDR